MRRRIGAFGALLLTLAAACGGAADGSAAVSGGVPAQIAQIVPSDLVRVDSAHRGGVLALAFVRDGRLLSAGGDSLVRLWELSSYEAVGRVGGRVLATTLAADATGGRVLVPGALGGALLLWDVAAQSVVERLPPAGELPRLALGDGLAAAGALDGTVTVWRAGSTEPLARLRPHEGRLLAVALPGGGRLLTAGDDGRLCTTAIDGDAAAPPQCVEAVGDGASVVAFAPDGARAAVGSRAGTVHLWETATGRALGVADAHTGEVTALAFLPDGGRLLTGGADRRATLVDAATLARLGEVEAPDRYVTSVAASLDGALAAIGTDGGAVLLWRMP